MTTCARQATASRAFRTLAVVGIEKGFPQADRLRRHFDEFVVLDVGEGLFQRHPDRRREAHGLILARRANIRELLALEDVDLEIVLARVLADDHAAVHLPAGLDHHRAAIFQLPHGVGDGFARIRPGNENAIATPGDLALVFRIGMEEAVHDRRPARVGQQLSLVADEAARRRMEDQAQSIRCCR